MMRIISRMSIPSLLALIAFAWVGSRALLDPSLNVSTRLITLGLSFSLTFLTCTVEVLFIEKMEEVMRDE